MLELTGVTRTFGGTRALDGVGFSVRPGRLTGFVGSNGAGKTTTMRIVMGVLAADAGDVRWHGRPLTPAVRRTFGYLPEERGLYPRMPVLEQLVFFGRLHGLPHKVAGAKAGVMLDQLGLARYARARLDTLSLGNQQRVQVAAALVHDPTLLVLDEPFSGLDPVAVDMMTAQLRERAAAGVPVLFSSHQLDLVERLCDDVVIIDAGRVMVAGDAARLRADSGRRYRLVLDGDPTWLHDVPGVRVVESDGVTVIVELPAPADSNGADETDQRLLRLAMARGAVREFRPELRTLAETFREVIR